MEVLRLNQNSIYDIEDNVVAIGFFDGLHLGHQQLLARAIDIANDKSLKKGFMTFDQHPRVVFGKKDFQYLMTLQQKMDIVEKMGFDYFFIIEFTKEVAHLEPEVFIQNYLINNHVKHVVCGFDFHFGNMQKGNGHVLKQLSKGLYDVDIIKKYEMDHKKVSSSIIRNYIQRGQIKKANELLGRPYRIHGKVIHGRKNGHKIGFPTANVDVGHYVILKKGVYAVYIDVAGQRYKGMANVGYNPTLGALSQISLEVHILDFDQDIYGEEVDVDFIEYTRKEVHFHQVNELIEQLTKDKEDIRQFLD